ncbi:hypothetical protein [Polynucleobacter sp. UK-Gri1-W3]|uniref:hypothetical protein n=1 Tax=Polynucleobacter sp. UK-Gri1-W3 TaxID=1819737 RepID=UPI001C0DC37B|nr:hypothetical protein [Polynucleobacter sp. UK-Gri1-W3]MBU3537409.1 hypothetical protein [Polynucleobacter sp. UK-Gri1-W3]
MKPLQSWSPDYLHKLYKHEVDKLTHGELNLKQKEVQERKIEALYRLGTYPDMKAVWEKLLSKDADMIVYPVDKELALVGGILEQIWINPFGEPQVRPSDKDEQLGEIAEKIKELQRLINKSKEASYEDGQILKTILHKRNIEYRNQHGEQIGSQSPNYFKFIDINANAELSQIALDEHMPWRDRYPLQRLGWWTREAMTLQLTDILGYYSERMGDYSKTYKDHYAKDTSQLSRGLSWLMNQIYGKDLDDYVARIINAILDVDSWDKDKVRKNRTYEKAK